MGRGHAASGMAAGAACTAWGLPALDYVVPGGVWPTILLGAILAGWSLAPDIDHERATATTAFGPFSRFTHRLAARASYHFTKATGTKYDEPREHRGLTHTPTFCVGVFVVLAVLGERWPRAVIAVVVGLAVGMLVRLLAKPPVSMAAGALAGVALFAISVHVPGPGPLLAAGAAALGCAVHIWGDWITREGVPLAAPWLKVRGKRWWNFRLPLVLTFKAGSTTENVFVAGFWMVTLLATAKTAGVL